MFFVALLIAVAVVPSVTAIGGGEGATCDAIQKPCKAGFWCIAKRDGSKACHQSFSMKKGEKCTYAETGDTASTFRQFANCKEGLYCKIKEDEDEGTCEQREKNAAVCSPKQGTTNICANGYGCNKWTSGSNIGNCAQYNSISAGTGTDNRAGSPLFCKPWLTITWKDGIGYCTEPTTDMCNSDHIDGYGGFRILEDGKCIRIGNDKCVDWYRKATKGDFQSRAVLDTHYAAFFYNACQSGANGWAKTTAQRWTFSWVGILLLVAACVFLCCCCACSFGLAILIIRRRKNTDAHYVAINK